MIKFIISTVMTIYTITIPKPSVVGQHTIIFHLPHWNSQYGISSSWRCYASDPGPPCSQPGKAAEDSQPWAPEAMWYTQEKLLALELHSSVHCTIAGVNQRIEDL